ncbi:MAG TPA: chondroitinase-B domain-containing protein, partial [Minicystis sp.]|nr:chondroitinase-B domain-containing protein [Minicystis sp.]
MSRSICAAAVLAILASATAARADDVLHPGTPELDPPTLTALGVVLPITGDDDFSATVSVRYKKTGTSTWHDAMPLVHVHAEAVQGLAVSPQFAGTIFDLRPGTSYDVELHAVDADGGVDQTLMVSGTTRKVPGDPANPHVVMVGDAASLSAALAAAQPGDVITLANGTYAGQFSFSASGTAADPIVVRGASRDGVILDGQGCTGCNVLEVYGSFVHVEKLTIAHGERAIRFQGQGAQENVVRRTHIEDVVLGIGSKPDQQNFYIADNLLEGRLTWPCVYASMDAACNGDAGGTVQQGLHANDDGIHVEGNGHVVSHNTISGFGDAMKTEEDGARSVDFVGNDVLWTYDNGVELDGSARNTRAYENRFTNTYATLSFQPIFGGPSYAVRNVLVNVADEQFKLHSRGSVPTVGAVILHNTVVRATRALQCATSATPLYFTLRNNLFIGPAALDPDLHAVRWDVPDVLTASMDDDGFFPDGQYEYGYANGNGGITYGSFAELVAGGKWETHGTLVTAATLAGGLVGPADWTAKLDPTTPVLAKGSPAIDKGVVLENIDDGMTGAAPDLGALELGCAAPTYGVRPDGVDESNEPVGCDASSGSGGSSSGSMTSGPGAGGG